MFGVMWSQNLLTSMTSLFCLCGIAKSLVARCSIFKEPHFPWILRSLNSSMWKLLVFVLSVSSDGKMNGSLTSASLTITQNHDGDWMFSFRNYRYILRGQIKPNLIRWVQHLIEAEYFINWEKLKNIRRLDFLKALWCGRFSSHCDRNRPFLISYKKYRLSCTTC